MPWGPERPRLWRGPGWWGDEAGQHVVRCSSAGPGRAVGFALPPRVFPIYLAVWRAPDGRSASVLVLGSLAGGYLLRTTVVEASGVCAWDGATPYPSDMDDAEVWERVEEMLDLVGVMGEWVPAEPMVIDYKGFDSVAHTAPRPAS